jgi:hypothetical protein
VNRLCAIGLSVLLAGSLAGCGGEDDDIRAQNERVATELFGEIELASSGARGTALSDVACVRPRPGRFLCTVYVQVRDGVALFAEYTVRECETGWRAHMKSSPDWLLRRLPTNVERERDPNFDACPGGQSLE